MAGTERICDVQRCTRRLSTLRFRLAQRKCQAAGYLVRLQFACIDIAYKPEARLHCSLFMRLQLLLLTRIPSTAEHAWALAYKCQRIHPLSLRSRWALPGHFEHRSLALSHDRLATPLGLHLVLSAFVFFVGPICLVFYC